MSWVPHTGSYGSQDREVLSKVGRSKVWKRSGYEVCPAAGEEAPEDYCRIGQWDIPQEAADKLVAQWGEGYTIATDGEMVSADREGAEDALAELKELETAEAMRSLRGKGFRRDTGESKAMAEVQATLALLLQAQTVAAPVAVPVAVPETAPVVAIPVAAPVAAVPAKDQSVGADAMDKMMELLQSLSKQVAAQGSLLAEVRYDLYQPTGDDEASDDSENGENGES